MPKFNKKSSPTKTINSAGGVAYSMDAPTELVHSVLTTFLEDKFYESGEERKNRIARLVAQNNPRFVANLAVVARREFNLRSVSTVLVGELSKIHRGDSLIRDTIVAATTRVDDLTELLSYLGTPVPKQVKRGVRNALLKFNRYQLAKYKAEGKGVSLVDLFNLVHPKVKHASEEQVIAWKDLIEGNLKSFDTWETEISNAKDDEERTQKWEALVRENKLGYMALLRNLNNLQKYGVSTEVKELAVKKLTDKEEVLKSKQLPFRFVTAYDNVKGDRLFYDAISEAMDIAVENTPNLLGNTLIAVDGSGSMTSNGAIKQAAIFAATLLKANKNADVVLYDTTIERLGVSGRVPVIDIAKGIEQKANGGGTKTSLVFEYAHEVYKSSPASNKKTYDRIIILSDNESWSENVFGGSVQSAYHAFKRITATDPFIYAVDIAGYGTKDLTGEHKKVFHLTGWSNRLLDFIGQAEKGEKLVDYIRDYVITDYE